MIILLINKKKFRIYHVYIIRSILKKKLNSKNTKADWTSKFNPLFYYLGKITLTLKRSPSMVISIFPCIALHKLSAMDNPSPLPSWLRDLSPRTNRSLSSFAEISSFWADTFFISMAEGAGGITALNLVLPIYSLIFGIGSMIGVGSAIRFNVLRAPAERLYILFLSFTLLLRLSSICITT